MIAELAPTRDAALQATTQRPRPPAAKGGSPGGRPLACVAAAADPNLHRLARAIADRVGPQRFLVWFEGSTRLGFRNDALEIAVPNEFIRDWISQRFSGLIQEAAAEVLGGNLTLSFQIQPHLFGEHVPVGVAVGPSPATAAPTAFSPAMPPPAAAVTMPARAVAQVARRGSLPAPRLRHRLETFIVGPTNQLAHNAVLHVAQYPGTQYNPLFIHGGCGLGKTHLIQGLCNKFHEAHPSKRHLYLTGEEFTNDYLMALRTQKVESFRRRMRDVDLLVIDDVHFLAGKKATQEEFLHTFNAIEASGRQVVMASDAHPREIAAFGESLISRFVSGMVVRIDPPNTAMRCEILRRLAREQKIDLAEEALAWVARRVTQNVRELEGAMTRISAHLMMAGGNGPATLAVAQQALGDLERMLLAPLNPDSVCAAVAAHFSIDPADLKSGKRHHAVSLARSMAMYLIRKTAKLSYPEIGQRLGNRNHSTVISACRRVEAAVAKNERLEWSSPTGTRSDEAAELVQRLEDAARAGG